MSDDGAGCIGALFGLALLAWVPLHFSGKAILYGRSETQTSPSGAPNYLVTCKYFNSTGLEETFNFFMSVPAREAYYCPRTKDIGQ